MRKTKKSPLWYNPVEKETRIMRLEGREVFELQSSAPPTVREEVLLMPAYRSIHRKKQ